MMPVEARPFPVRQWVEGQLGPRLCLHVEDNGSMQPFRC